jgi:hypothetical protein
MASKQITSSLARNDLQVQQTTNKLYAQPVSSSVGSAPDIILADNTPEISTLEDGQPIQITLGHGSNTIVNPTLQIGSTDSKEIVKDDNQPLLVGDTGTLPIFSYSAAFDKYILMNPFSITNNHLAPMLESTVKGRVSGSGTGVPVDLTDSQARTALGLGGLSVLNSVGQGQIDSGAIHTDELDTGLFSATISSNQLTVMSTGSYGFYPVLDHSTTGGLNVSISLEDDLSAGGLVNYLSTGAMSGGTLTVNQVFVNSSPPYTLGHGDIPYFFFIRVNSLGAVISTTSAPVPPWAYNGPTSVIPDFKGRDGKKYQIHSGIDMSDPDWFQRHMDGEIFEDKIIEITHDIKNADMDLLPHSFYSAEPSDTIALLDPLSTQKLGDLARNGVEIGKLIEDGHLKITNDFLDQNAPNGVKIIPIKWK